MTLAAYTVSVGVAVGAGVGETVGVGEEDEHATIRIRTPRPISTTHALMLSRKLLSREKGGNRQILVITDGEPTAHLEGDRAFFAYPPSYRTEQETLKEVKRYTQEDILINTFMLENSYQLVIFVDRMTRINRGRVVLQQRCQPGGVCAGGVREQPQEAGRGIGMPLNSQSLTESFNYPMRME